MRLRRGLAMVAGLGVAHAATINDVQPSKGSLAGGTYVTIWGDGFFRNGQDGTTRVFFGTDEAEVVEYDSSDVKLVVYTPPRLTDETATIRVGLVSADGKAAYARCPTASKCAFAYQAGVTPGVEYMTMGAGAGQVMRMWGRLYGLTPGSYSITVGGFTCDVDEDFYPNDARLVDPSTRLGTVRCRLGGPLEAGRYNVSVRVRDDTAGYGEASYARRINWSIEPGTGALYRTTVHPLVTGLSYAATGLGGGGELVVSGSGFSWDAADNAVTLAGVPCAVTNATPTELRCVPGPAAASTNVTAVAGVAYPGGRGLLHRWFAGTRTVDTPMDAGAVPTRTWVNTDGLSSGSFYEAETFTEELTGFFVPPVTANYSFYARGDDYVSVWLSPDASPARRTRIAYVGGWTPYWAVAPGSGQISAPRLLQAGVPYSLAVLHSDVSADDWFDVGVRVHLEGNAAAGALFGTPNHVRYRSTPEHQRIGITTTVVREMQQFVVAGANGGFFTLAVGGSVRTDSTGQPVKLAWNAANTAVETYVRAVIGCSNIAVARTPVSFGGNNTGFAWNVTIGCPTDAPWAGIVPYSVSLTPAPGVDDVTLSNSRPVPPSRPVSGSFRLSLGGNVSNVVIPAASDSTAGKIKEALVDLGLPRTVEVSGYLTALRDGGSWLVIFHDTPGDVPLLQVVAVSDASGPNATSAPTLFGTDVAATVVEVIKGSMDPLFYPPPTEWLRAPLAVNAPVLVTTNGILGGCDPAVWTPDAVPGPAPPNCTFVYDAALTPSLASVSASSAVAGDVLTLTGAGFLPASAGAGRGPLGADLPLSALNAVTLNGTAACNITAATATSLTCTLTDVPAGVYVVGVLVGDGRGVAVPASGTSLPSLTVVGRLDAVSPSSGSLAGGTRLTLSGTGFQRAAADNVVTIGGAPCAVQTASVTSVVCLTPPAPGGAAGPATVSVAGAPAAGASTFTYSAALTPSLVDLAPRALSAALSGTITLNLTNLAGVGAAVAGDPAAYTITLGYRTCRVTNVTYTPGSGAGDAVVRCTLIRGRAEPLPQAPLLPLVAVAPAGYAANPSSLTLDAGFRVDGMSSQTGSLAGGTVVTFTGVGFSPRDYQVEVEFRYTDQFLYDWVVPATITAVSPTSVTAVVPVVPLWKRGRANSTTPQPGVLALKVNNITAPCAAPLSGCAFTQSMDYTPVVTSAGLSPDRTMLTLNGTNLGATGLVTTVTFGGYACTGVQLSAAFDRVDCAVDPATAGTHLVAVAVSGWGDGRCTSTVDIPLVVPAWPAGAPSRGSLDGGLAVTFAGAGFASEDITRNVVRFGSATAVPVAATHSSLTVLTPPAAVAGTVDVTVSLLTTDGVAIMLTAAPALSGAFTYDAALAFTPTLASVTPRSGFAGTLLFIRGAGFGNSSDALSISIGGVPCPVDAGSPFNASFVACTLGNTPGGVHRVLVTVAGKGLARGSTVRFTAGLEVTAQAGPTSGLGGGRLVTLAGRGFPTDPAQVVVSACNSRCTVLSSTYDRLVCASSQLLTVAGLQALRVWEPAALVPPRTPTGAAAAALDGDVETSFTSCTVDVDLGADTLAVMTSLRLYPKYLKTRNANGAVFLGRATAAANWTVLTQVSASYVQEGWNEWPVAGFSPSNNYASVDWTALPAVRFLRFAFAAGTSDCTANEVEFRGIPVSPTNVCPLNVTVYPAPGAMAPFTGAVNPASAAPGAAATLTYDLPNTPVVAAVSPDYGTALGGDVVTLTGSGFGTDPGALSVALNGMPCVVLTASGTSLTCRTSPRTDIMPLSINVTLGGEGGTGIAVYDASRTYFRYLDRWSALTTWKYNEPPVEGDSVVVPPGQSILVDVTPPRLFLVLVQGDLVFDRADLAFDATYIFVHGGRFEVGTEARPFTNRLTITLHGDRRDTIEIPDVGAKCLAVMSRHTHVPGMVMGGVPAPDPAAPSNVPRAPQMATPIGYSQGWLELHGTPRQRVWTRLGAAVAAGSDVVTTAEDVDWAVGETLVVTNTYDVDLTETVVVAQVLGPRALRVSRPFAYAHDCRVVPATEYGFEDVNLCGEVALMSRNVIIRGDPDVSPRQLFGVHTGAMHGGVYHVENVELTHCGQQGLLGRYCTHFHMTNDNWESYVRFNSIHHSFQRATTIHATNHATVKHNAAYDVFGHTIFVEDGVERYNVIEENLVVHSKPCGMCIASDKKPANFWMASPTNFWRHNVGAGSTHFSFWFELPGNPHGPSYTPNYCPVAMPLGEFYNNTAHSSSIGLRIYPQYFPRAAGCDGGPTSPQYFRNNTYFHNGQGMFHRNVGDLHHIGGRYVENWGEDVSWKIYRGVDMDWDPNLDGCLFICDGRPNAGCGTRAVTAPQDEFWYARGLTLVNYRGVGALAGCHSCDTDEDYRQGGYTYRWEGLTWINTTKRTFWNPPRKCIFWDVDGTLTGYPGGMVTPFYRWNNRTQPGGDGCPRDTGALDGTVCDGTVPIRRVQIDNFEPASSLQWQSLNVTASGGRWDLMPYRPKDFSGWAFPVVANRAVGIKWANTVLSDWQRLSVRYSEPAYVTDPAEYLVANFSWIDYRYRNLVRYGTALTDPEIPPLPPGRALDPAVHGFGVGTHPNGTAQGNWSVLITPTNATKPGADRLKFTVWNIQCPPWGCYVPPGPGQLVRMLWSDNATWPGGRFPAAGDDVVVNSTTHLIMDVNPPRLGKVTIQGKLEFDDGAPRRLEAALIINWGNFTIGSPDAPFINPAEVVLHGVRSSPVAIVDNNLFVGNKVLVNLGSLTAYGRPVAVPWTFLNATAYPGNTTLTLAAVVDDSWSPGDRIVLSPTQYDHTTAETAVIASVAGNVVTLAAPLAYRHYAGAAGAGAVAGGVQLRAAVGLLSRNVVIRGNVTGAADTYGAHIFTSVVRRTGQAPRTGSLDLRFVELRSMGKGSMEYPALHFQYGSFLFDPSIPSSNPRNYLEGVSLTDGFNHAIEAKAAKGLVVNASVVYRTYRNGLHADAASTGLVVVGSLFVSNLRSPSVNAPDQTPWVVPQAAIYSEAPPARLVGNVVGGAIDAAYTIRVPSCATANVTYGTLGGSVNEAHGVRVGAFLLSSGGQGACVSLANFRVWKASHLGVVTVDQTANVVLRGVTVADSHIGVSLNFLRPGTVQAEGWSRLEGVTLIGTTPATAGCGSAEDTTCRAADKEDVTGAGCNSVLGGGYRRAGLLLPQYTSKGKTCEFDDFGALCLPVNTPAKLCSMPWEKRMGVAGSAHVGLYLSGVRFVGFAGSECGSLDSRAVVANPSQVDLAVPAYARGIVWEDTPEAARFDFRSNEFTHADCALGAGCDATNFINWRDEDGSLTGAGRGAHVLGPNPLLAFPSPQCTERSGWPGIVCTGAPFRTGVLTSVEREAGHLNLGALQVARLPPGVTDFDDNSTSSAPRTTLSRGSLKDSCSMQDYWPQYPHIVVPNNITHSLYLPATEPGAMQYQLLSPDPYEATVIQLAIQRPYAWEMYVTDCANCRPNAVEMMVPANRSDPTLPGPRDPPGTWLHNPQRRKLWFTVRGGAPERTYRLVRTPAIQVTMHLAISADQFFGPDLVANLALLLGIAPGQIKIVDVRPGSTVVDMSLRDSAPTVLLPPNATADDNATAAYTAQFARVGRIAQQLTSLTSSGQLTSIGSVPVLAVEVTVPPEAWAAIGVDPANPSGDGGGKPGLTAGQAGGIAAGVVVAVALVAGLAVMALRRRVPAADDASAAAAGVVSALPPPSGAAAGSSESVAPPGSSAEAAAAGATFEGANPSYAHPVPVVPLGATASGTRASTRVFYAPKTASGRGVPHPQPQV